MNSPRFSILALATVLTSGFILTGCGKTSLTTAPQMQPTSSASSTNTSLPTLPNADLTRERMQELYAKARASVDEAVPDTYFTFVEEITNGEQVAEFRNRWSESETKRALKTFALPDVAKGKYLDFKQEGDWAGYYYLSELEDTSRITIELVRFHRKDGRWMVYPRGGSYSTEAPATEAERTAVINEAIAESDALRLKAE